MTPNELRTMRKKAGLSQNGLARLLGITVDTVRNWEKKRRNITTVAEIAIHARLKEVAMHAPTPYLVRITGTPSGGYNGRYALISDGIHDRRFLTLIQETGDLEEDSSPVDSLSAWDWEGVEIQDLPVEMMDGAQVHLENSE